jgi:choline dehydrogenase
MVEFDFIVVGAGSAGCAAAARLSEERGASVLLLEAGPRDRNPWIHVPVGYYRTIFDPRIGWGYETDAIPNCDGRSIPWPRGKVLGGSSSINGLVYIRGQREDFDHWRQLGNRGWSYDDVLPYFRRAEGQTSEALVRDEHHGAGGPLGVSETHRHPLCDAYVAAAVEAGIPRNDDFNGAQQEGVGYFQLTVRNGLRCSSAAAYLGPARGRDNLHIETDAHATAVVTRGQRAIGVRYHKGGHEHEVRARAEVILCGGAINSPQLLQLSGIGPRALLAEHGIPVVQDLPGVGEDLQDHFQARTVYECTRPWTVNDEVKNPLRKVLVGMQWLVTRGGPLSVGAGHVGLFARTREELVSPDVQFHVIRFSAKEPGEGLHPFSGFTVSVCQLRPESRGSIRIKTSDPFAAPSIQPNYLDTPGDRQTMLDGMALVRRIAAQPAIRDLIKREVLPGPEVNGDEGMAAYIRDTGYTIFHPSGTCRMGSDERAVVDERLRVRGMQGLRVADASVMPTVVSGNTNAACIMIGEKLADMVHEDRSRAAA